MMGGIRKRQFSGVTDKAMMKKVSYHLPSVVIDKLKRLSEKTGLSVAELIRRAVDAYLKKEGVK